MLLIYVAHFSKNREISLSDITTEKEHAAKAAFNNAVNDGEDANALYMSWKAVKDELGMLQAQLEALANSGIGKQVPLIAKQMESEGHKEVDTIQAEKVKLFEELEAFRL